MQLPILRKDLIAIIGNKIGVDFKATTRKRELVYYRHALSYILYNNADLGLSEIGRLLDKTHATIINSIKETKNLVECGDRQMAIIYDEVYKAVRDTLGNRFKTDNEYESMATEIVSLLRSKDPYFGHSRYSTNRIIYFIKKELGQEHELNQPIA